MKNLNNVKNRFEQLIESELGNVKPLVEQTSIMNKFSKFDKCFDDVFTPEEQLLIPNQMRQDFIEKVRGGKIIGGQNDILNMFNSKIDEQIRLLQSMKSKGEQFLSCIDY